jgi:hypothetical protein
LNNLTPTAGELINIALAAAPAHKLGYDFWTKAGLWCWLGTFVGYNEAMPIDMWTRIHQAGFISPQVQAHPTGTIWHDTHEPTECGAGQPTMCKDGHPGRFLGLSRAQQLTNPDMAMALSMCTQRAHVFQEAVWADKARDGEVIAKLDRLKTLHVLILKMELTWAEAAKKKADLLAQAFIAKQMESDLEGMKALAEVVSH